jgi:hypothetical protein
MPQRKLRAQMQLERATGRLEKEKPLQFGIIAKSMVFFSIVKYFYNIYI